MTDYTWLVLCVEGLIIIAGIWFIRLAYLMEKGLKTNQRKRIRK